MTRKLTGLVLMVFALSFAASAQKRYEMTAKDAVAFARKNNNQVKNALIDIQIQEQTNREVTAAAFPQVNGSVGLNYFPNVATQRFPNFIAAGTYGVLEKEGVLNGSGTPITIPSEFGFINAQFGSKFQNNIGINLQQLLFDGQVFVGLQARSTAINWSRKAAEVTEEGIITNVYKNYYLLSASKNQLNILDANITTVEKFLSDTRKMYEQGFSEKLDINRLEVQVSNLRTEKQKVLNTIENGYLSLKFLMGMPLQDTLVLTESITEEDVRRSPVDPSTYHYTDRKDYQYAELGRQLNEYNIRRYKLTRIPTVALNGNYNYIRQSDKFGFGGPWNPSSLIGVSINVPIFDGFARAARIQKATLELHKTVNEMDMLRQNIDVEVRSAVNNYNNALATLDNQKRNMDLAQEVYDQTRLKFQNGIGSNTETTSAQNDLQTAQNNYILALYDAINAKINFLQATGKLQ
ncbi:MAG: TolC family protein [Flavisolibacter sp.]|jgi:outer membrane protein